MMASGYKPKRFLKDIIYIVNHEASVFLLYYKISDQSKIFNENLFLYIDKHIGKQNKQSLQNSFFREKKFKKLGLQFNR